MTYASHAQRPNPAALAGALGIPAAVGALLVVGLAVKVAIAPTPPNPKGETITTTPLTPPPPPKPVEPQPTSSASTTTTGSTTIPTTPSQPSALPVDLGTEGPITFPTGGGDTMGPIDLGTIGNGPVASPFDPVGAQPRGNPGRWVTNEDYRPRWIREEMSGAARFTLAIDASGKVTGCTITRSTGHAPLDAATCDLVTKRARFDAARDGTGKPVAGSYSGTITWRIPE